MRILKYLAVCKVFKLVLFHLVSGNLLMQALEKVINGSDGG